MELKYSLTWVSEEEREAEASLDYEWEEANREVECDDAVGLGTKGLQRDNEQFNREEHFTKHAAVR